MCSASFAGSRTSIIIGAKANRPPIRFTSTNGELMRTLLLLLAAVPLTAQTPMEGQWLGSIKAGAIELRVALHLNKSPNGSFTGALDSIDQGARGLPVNDIVRKDNELSFKVPTVNGSWAGT